jgi:hypothetical protein
VICIIVTDFLPAFVAGTIYVPGVSEDVSFQSFRPFSVEALLCSGIITIFNLLNSTSFASGLVQVHYALKYPNIASS